MVLEAIELFDALLTSGIIGADAHRAVVESIWRQQEFSAEETVSFALFQSIRMSAGWQEVMASMKSTSPPA